MTVELDNVIENLNGEIIHLEIYNDDGDTGVYISTDSSSGCDYKVHSVQEVAEWVKHYLMNYYADNKSGDE